MNWAERLDEVLMSQEELEQFLGRMAAAPISPEDYRRVETLCQLAATLGKNNLNKLKQVLFGRKTETTDKVCGAAQSEPEPLPPPCRTKKGHGRNSACRYTGARWIPVSHPSMRNGDLCPKCQKGRVRKQRTPAVVMRIVGSPPVSATAWALEKLRCDTCGQVFTAPTPPEAGDVKYDPSVAVTVALLRYGTGMPHYRLARLQQSLGVPLPQSTQWELMLPLAQLGLLVLAQLIRLAAQSPVFYNDDTSMRVLELRRPGSATAHQIDPKRKGTFTTGIIAQVEQYQVALYMTGWQHAGENLAAVLQHRAAELEAPIQMCDALSRNTCGDFVSTLANCMSHGRREFVGVAPAFPEEVRHVLEEIREIYRVDAKAKELELTAPQRLRFHQAHSQPVMDRLHLWMKEQLDHKKVEPNSGLGQAINYMLKHWEPLTLFLRKEGAPLDNNICERALKMAILHRKNSLSYKTANGARIGDMFMSLIQTCRYSLVNTFDYFMALATHPQEVSADPAAWLPWNYPKADSG